MDSQQHLRSTSSNLCVCESERERTRGIYGLNSMGENIRDTENLGLNLQIEHKKLRCLKGDNKWMRLISSQLNTGVLREHRTKKWWELDIFNQIQTSSVIWGWDLQVSLFIRLQIKDWGIRVRWWELKILVKETQPNFLKTHVKGDL